MSCSCGSGGGSCSCTDPKTLQLQDEYGQVHAFYLSDRVIIHEKRYVFAVDLEDSERYALLRVELDREGKETYSNIQNEQEWGEIEEYLAKV